MKNLAESFQDRLFRLWKYLFFLFFFGWGTLFFGISHASEVSLDDLNKNPDQFYGQTVTMRGKLRMIGKNYFDPSSKFVIEDHNGKMISVKPWLPLEIAPASPNRPLTTTPMPKIMSDYIGKEVKMTGKVQLNDSRHEHEIRPDQVEEVNP
ncbi:MAG: hypothetical protein HY200_03570 [Nitrospirae bacterium]|nr:hypothetical protein [Nitrospirota bacterium]